MHSLGENLDHMRKGLRSFERYVSAALVRSLIRSGVEASPGGEDQEVTILFTDVEGFTTISEGLKPHDLALKLSNNLEEASLIVDAHQGTVDKYIGDSVMAFWNAPDPVPDHALQACQAALKILARIRESANDTEPLWPIRIGINTTVALVGNLGSISHLDYTVIGDGVNLASRIEGINKNYGTRVLIGEQTKQAVSKKMLSRPVDRVIVKGQSRPEPIHELLVERASASPVQLALAEATKEGFAAYLDQRWEHAEAAYSRCLELQSDDSLALLFIERCRALKGRTLPDWNGVYT
jgi:adenylate cyclase